MLNIFITGTSGEIIVFGFIDEIGGIGLKCGDVCGGGIGCGGGGVMQRRTAVRHHQRRREIQYHRHPFQKFDVRNFSEIR